LPFGRGALSALPFCPWAGGVLELSGVFGGCPSLASSQATRSFNPVFAAISAVFSLVNPSTRAINASTRAISVRISASFSTLDREENSVGPATHTLIQIRRPSATLFIDPESTRRTPSTA